MGAEARLQQLGLTLPILTPPSASFLRHKRVGNLLFLSGQGARDADGALLVGKVGSDITLSLRPPPSPDLDYLSRRNARAESGTNTASRTAGHAIASGIAASANHPDVMPVGLPNSSRAAVAVAEIGFHSAIARSQPGIVSGATKTFDAKPSGQTRTCTAVVAPLR